MTCYIKVWRLKCQPWPKHYWMESGWQDNSTAEQDPPPNLLFSSWKITWISSFCVNQGIARKICDDGKIFHNATLVRPSKEDCHLRVYYSMVINRQWPVPKRTKLLKDGLKSFCRNSLSSIGFIAFVVSVVNMAINIINNNNNNNNNNDNNNNNNDANINIANQVLHQILTMFCQIWKDQQLE